MAAPRSHDEAPGADGAAAPAEDPVVVEARGLGKRFDIYLSDRGRVLEFFSRRRHHHEHWALRDVSFQVRRGVSFGVIGANGAGKSTLLKLLAGITQPTEGWVEVRARLATLLDLGLGFHPNFTGRENIYLNCSLLGMDREEVDARLPEIVAFAELGEFIDYPVRTYSAGMRLRLGFATAVHLDSDIFLVDEVLAVGDQYFQRKCVDRIRRFVGEGGTIVLVTHDLHAIRSVCREAMWLDGGRVRAIGPSREVVERYLDADRARIGLRSRGPLGLVPSAAPPPRPRRSRMTADDPRLLEAVATACAVPDPEALWAERAPTRPFDHHDGDVPVVIGSGEVRILDVQILDGRGQPRERFRTGESMVVAVTFRTTEPVVDPIMGVAIHRNDGVYVYGPNTRFDGVFRGTYHGIYTYFIHYPRLDLLSGSYRVSVAVFDRDHLKPHVWHNQLYGFEVAQHVEDHGLVRLPHAWGLITHLADEAATGDGAAGPGDGGGG